MSNVIIKMDSKVLDDLVRKEVMEFERWKRAPINVMYRYVGNDMYAVIKPSSNYAELSQISLDQLYKIFSQSKEKVND